MNKIEILLATYNGEKYIEEQIKSIINQDGNGNLFLTHITVRDDGSKDNTLDILSRLKNEFKNIDIINDGMSLGFKDSFKKLILSAQKADYYFFADQDDIWIPSKINKMISKIENLNGVQLVHSDLLQFGTKKGLLSNSKPKINHKDDNSKTLAVRNIVTGAAMMLNAAAFELVKENAVDLFNISKYHDQLIGMLIGNLGCVHFCSEPLVMYRRHENNVTLSKTKHIDSLQRFREFVDIRINIAEVLMKKYGNILIEKNNYEFMKTLSGMHSSNKMTRLKSAMYIYKFLYPDLKTKTLFIIVFFMGNIFKTIK